MEESLKKRQEEFLSHFPGYRWKIFPDQRIKWKITAPNINRTFDEVLELNRQNASSLYFTPNGRFADSNSVWSQCSLQAQKSSKDCWMNAYVLDFNLIKFPDKTMDTLLEYIVNLLAERIIIKWRYIVKTQKWYHVYFILNHEQRDVIFTAYWYWQLDIVKHMAEMLWADASTKVTNNIWALFRVPYSMYWDLTEAKYVEIVKFQNEYVNVEEVDALRTYIQQYDNMSKAEKRAFQWSNWAKYRNFSNTDIKTVVSKINSLHWWVIKDPKYSDRNSLINRIWDNLYEHPMWRPYQVAWCVNHWDEVATRDMLHKDFWIKELRAKDWSWNIIKVIEWNGYVISFFETSVQLKSFEANNKWDIVEKTKTIFRNNIEVRWKWTTNSTKMWEWDSEKKIYIFMVNWEEKIVQQIPNKRAFNQQYPELFFYGDDNDLWLFFHGLNNCEEIDVINIYERSWYYDDICILWDRCIVWFLWDNKVMLGTNEFDLCNDALQISASEYLERFKECYLDEFSIPVFLSALALAGMNLWNMLEVNPAMLIAGKTGCWKSTVAALLKRMLGYWPTVREMALPGITPQPLKQTASDNAILFLEELTNRVGPTTEELLRNIVNRDKAARGWLEWNTWWAFRSPLWVNWERTFKDESLNNRFCSFIMSPAYWREWATSKINELQKYTAYLDIYNTYINSQDLLADLVLEYKNKLLEKGYPARACDVWCYIFVVNDIFNFKYSFDQLCKYVDVHLSNTGLKETKSFDSILSFERFITVNVINKKINMTVLDTRKPDENWIDRPRLIFNLLFIDDTIYQTHRWALNSTIAEINRKYWQTLFEVDDWGIIWYMCDSRTTGWKHVWEANQFMADMFWRVVSVLPWNITANNHSLIKIDRA